MPLPLEVLCAHEFEINIFAIQCLEKPVRSMFLLLLGLCARSPLTQRSKWQNAVDCNLKTKKSMHIFFMRKHWTGTDHKHRLSVSLLAS